MRELVGDLASLHVSFSLRVEEQRVLEWETLKTFAENRFNPLACRYCCTSINGHALQKIATENKQAFYSLASHSRRWQNPWCSRSVAEEPSPQLLNLLLVQRRFRVFPKAGLNRHSWVENPCLKKCINMHLNTSTLSIQKLPKWIYRNKQTVFH